MREIKFRAFDIVRNEILEVDSISDIDVTVSPKYNDDEGNESYDLGRCLFDDGSGKIEAIVMQYVGVKDSEDMDVYEGDIIQFGDEVSTLCDDNKPLRGQVIFSDGGYWSLMWINTTGIGSRSLFEYRDFSIPNDVSDDDSFTFEFNTKPNLSGRIIGNIYENGDLL